MIDGIVRDGARRMLAAALQAEVEFDLRVEAPGPGSEIDADLVLVSNNVYRVERLSGFETRARLDEGVNSQSFPTARRGA